jgi:hypothetical protein
VIELSSQHIVINRYFLIVPFGAGIAAAGTYQAAFPLPGRSSRRIERPKTPNLHPQIATHYKAAIAGAGEPIRGRPLLPGTTEPHDHQQYVRFRTESTTAISDLQIDRRQNCKVVPVIEMLFDDLTSNRAKSNRSRDRR